ncbi:hypothetical protein LINGRAHAP2_LOCUS4968 [Linum grandiflorum]
MAISKELRSADMRLSFPIFSLPMIRSYILNSTLILSVF